MAAWGRARSAAPMAASAVRSVRQTAACARTCYIAAMEPTTIAAQLREFAVYFDLDGDRHRAIAYDKAARSIEAAKGLDRLLAEGRLEELPGIGPKIAKTVEELARNGSSVVLDNLRVKWPAVIVELAQLPSI